jgi:ribonucleoside-diphosphate reductase alpha chain
MKSRFHDDEKPFAEPMLSAVVETSGEIGPDGVLMQQFNSQFKRFQDDAPACDVCGSITVRNGTCYRCHNCGNSMGCS